MKLSKNKKYVAVMEMLDNGKLKISKAKEYYRVNQHKSGQKIIDSREFARALNTSELLIK